MSRVRYQLAVSIDGFIAPEDGSIDWLNPYGAVGMEVMGAFMKEIGGAVMGRATYDQAAAMGDGMYGDMPTLVMTSRPISNVQQNVIVEGGAPAAALEKLKSRMKKGDIWLMGGGATAAHFLGAGLIDMIELTTVPVVLGRGRPLFGGGAPPRTFRLRSSAAGKLGTVSTVYERA